MKLKHNILFIFMTLTLCASQSCKSDDDGMGGDGQVDTFITTCCEIPHLEGCVGGAEFYVPNAFTANGDGFNDVFLIFGSQGVKEISSFKIFNSNSDMVFEKFNFQPNDLAFGWDGRLPDGMIVEGIYSYTVEVTNVADETTSFDGSVCCRTSVDVLPCVDHEQHCAYSTQHNGNGGFEPTLPTFEDCE